MPRYSIGGSVRAFSGSLSCPRAAVLAFIYCALAYLLITLVAAFEVHHGGTHEHVALFWAFALSTAFVMLTVIGLGAWRERKLTEATARVRHTQNELAQTQERYRLIETAVNDGIWDWNLLTGEAYMSPRWKNMLGYDDSDLVNVASTFFDLIHPDDKAAVNEAIRAQIEEEQPIALDLRLRCKDGRYRWVHSRGKAVRDETNRPIRMLGTTTDISERKQHEDLIAESRDNLARAEQMARLGHFKCDHGSPERTWSEGLYRIFGQSPETFTPTAENILAAFHPEDRPLLAQRHRDLSMGLEPPSRTLRVIRGDGQIIYVEDATDLIYASDGTLIGRFGTLQDVTAREQAKALIAESRDNLARAEEMALLGHIKFELETSTLTWSAGAYRIAGKSPDVFTPTADNVLELFHPDDRPALQEHRRAVLAGAEPLPATHRMLRDDGQVIYIENWSKPLRASDGTVIGMFGTIQDITARKEAEKALERANQELEARVAERTAELAQEMQRRDEAQMTLAQMQKMEAVGQLSAGMAHDFNNLLAVIGGSLEFIEGEAARGLPAEPDLIDAALRATRRGRDLVQRLLTFSRQSPLKAEPTVIDQMVLDTLRLLQRTLGENIDIVTRLNVPGMRVSVDQNQLANALLNLALNARDAMPEGGQLTIATACRPSRWAIKDGTDRWPTGEEICITITDTGVGMPEDVCSRAFEPFYTTKRDGLGSGLGLSMVLGFVQQSGGHIDIDSGPGRGTAITICLPRIEAAEQPREPGVGGDSVVNCQDKTVLLVEDDPDVRIVVTAQLKALGYTVYPVSNAMEAISVIESPTTIAVILTDMVLPGEVDGVTLLKSTMQARPRIGVLCMSGYDPTQSHRKWLQVQNIGLLEKPFTRTRLAQALDATLAQ
jgi:PAS domain S-box-containing protein